MGGLEIALKGILGGIGLNRVQLGGIPPQQIQFHRPLRHADLGIALGLFKAAQLIRSAGFSNHFRDFTAVDLETTDNYVSRAEVVEIAAVKVRGGAIVPEYHTLVKPRALITAGAFDTHGISAAELFDKPHFEEMWPALPRILRQRRARRPQRSSFRFSDHAEDVREARERAVRCVRHAASRARGPSGSAK